MDIYVHVAAGAAIGVLTKGAATLVFPALEEKCQDSISCKLAHALEWSTIYGAGVAGAVVSHVFLDMLPHGDYLAAYGDFLIPDSLWIVREVLAAMVVLLLFTLVLRGRSRVIAVLAGVGGTLLDVDNLAIGLGWITRAEALSPSHSGVWAHGQDLGVMSVVCELGVCMVALGIVFFHNRRQAASSPSISRHSKLARVDFLS